MPRPAAGGYPVSGRDGPSAGFPPEHGGERLLTALNAGDEPAVLALPWTEEPERLLGAGEWALTGEGPVLMLPPRSGGIWRVGEAEPAQM